MPDRVPPGPRGRPFVGNVREFNRDPMDFLARCAGEYGDIVRLRLFNAPFYFVNDPDCIEQVLVTDNQSYIKSKALRRSRLLLGNGLLTSEGDFWRRQRRLAQPAFHRARITAYGRVMVEYAGRMLESWQDGQRRDVHEDMMRLTLQVVAKTLFNADVTGETDRVGQAMQVATQQFLARASTGFLIPEEWPLPGNLRMRRAVTDLDAIIYGIIDQRRGNEADQGDLLSMLLSAQDEDGSKMTDKQLRDEAMTLFLAGHETTAIALSWTWYLLGRNPEARARLDQELENVLGGRPPTAEDLPRLPCVQAVINEALRLYPPAWILGREAVRDLELGGYRVPAGTTVLMSQWVMHHDPRYFETPQAFRPERWEGDLSRRLPKYAYFPFGGGPRLCIGSSFALMEAQLILATVAQRARLETSPDRQVQPLPSITLRPYGGVPVTVRLRARQ